MARILRDTGGFVLLCLAGAVVGLLLNQARSRPLPFIYIPAAQRELEPQVGGGVPSIGHVSLAELQSLLGRPDVILLDARPALLYTVGHIPGALSLPKEDFQSVFPTLDPRLRAPGIAQIVIYCSGDDCEDSAVVTQALAKAGCTRLAIFDGGWEEWELRANLPK